MTRITGHVSRSSEGHEREKIGEWRGDEDMVKRTKKASNQRQLQYKNIMKNLYLDFPLYR